MFNYEKKKLGNMMLDAGLITTEQLEKSIEDQKKTGDKLGEIVVKNGIVSKETILKMLEKQLGIPYIDLSSETVHKKVASMIPETMAKKHDIIPIELNEEILTVAISDPLDLTALDDIRIYTGLEVKPVIAGTEQIRNLISTYYSSTKAIQAVEDFGKNDQAKSQDGEATNIDIANSPAVKLVNIMIEQAYNSGASDIHIEPQDGYVRIRFRIDGQLQDIIKPDISMLSAIVSRIKVIASLNIAEKRLPQDGRTAYSIGANDLSLRISIIPSLYGEKVVIRLISKDSYNIHKTELGFLPENESTFNKMLQYPHGLILVTGPTGSGKTTTLYAALKELNQPNVNIVTVEDPVESSIEGITQVQINTGAGLKFANSLRSILRQDPDILLIGEIRDNETAEIAIRAAITGHLVLSTLHTNDAAGAVVRLVDMGIEPYLVSTSLIGVVSQRLVRRICTKCKTSYKPTKIELEAFEPGTEKEYIFYKGTGCKQCQGLEYKGRIAVHEVMKVDTDIRQAIYQGQSSDLIKKQAIKNGMLTLRENCKRLVLDGVTTLEEMIKVSYLQE